MGSCWEEILDRQHLLASCSHCLGFSLARPGAVAALHEALVHPRYTQLRAHVSLWESSCVYQWTGLSLKLTPGAAASEASEIPKYFGAVCAVQMSGVSGDKLCRFLPLPAILSHFHYLPFVEAVIYCILQPCNLCLLFSYNSFQAFRSNSSMYPTAFHCHTGGSPTSLCTSTLFLVTCLFTC